MVAHTCKPSIQRQRWEDQGLKVILSYNLPEWGQSGRHGTLSQNKTKQHTKKKISQHFLVCYMLLLGFCKEEWTKRSSHVLVRTAMTVEFLFRGNFASSPWLSKLPCRSACQQACYSHLEDMETIVTSLNCCRKGKSHRWDVGAAELYKWLVQWSFFFFH